MANSGTKMEVLKKIQPIKMDSIKVCISDHEEGFAQSELLFYIQLLCCP